MTHKIEGNKIIIEFDPESKKESSTGKSYLLANTEGFEWHGDIGIKYIIIKKKENEEK